MSNTERRVEQQFKSSHVGQLTERHERETVSRNQQAAIPAQGSTREQQQQQDTIN